MNPTIREQTLCDKVVQGSTTDCLECGYPLSANQRRCPLCTICTPKGATRNARVIVPRLVLLLLLLGLLTCRPMSQPIRQAYGVACTGLGHYLGSSFPHAMKHLVFSTPLHK